MMRSFHGVCLITRDVRRLREFYEEVLQVRAEGDDVFASFPTAGAQLSIFSQQGMEQMALGSTNQAGNGSCALEFEVEDVDREYERLKAMNVPIAKPPTTQPWGLRSVWFRDPDANMVNFYAHTDSQ
jgi:catechol 2,3-dioxygenase-like lactoylglutathione lyase family enzyme